MFKNMYIQGENYHWKCFLAKPVFFAIHFFSRKIILLLEIHSMILRSFNYGSYNKIALNVYVQCLVFFSSEFVLWQYRWHLCSSSWQFLLIHKYCPCIHDFFYSYSSPIRKRKHLHGFISSKITITCIHSDVNTILYAITQFH